MMAKVDPKGYLPQQQGRSGDFKELIYKARAQRAASSKLQFQVSGPLTSSCALMDLIGTLFRNLDSFFSFDRQRF